ncbi:MAG TPA: PDGLE domain-containing protein [Marmoricola sp.]
MTNRVLLVAGLLLALVLAGVVSHYASNDPDGLERVATEQGFDDAATEHHAADGPMADYATEGVDDERLSGGLAGVTGTLLVLLLAGGVAFAVRRRRGETDDGGG